MHGLISTLQTKEQESCELPVVDCAFSFPCDLNVLTFDGYCECDVCTSSFTPPYSDLLNLLERLTATRGLIRFFIRHFLLKKSKTFFIVFLLGDCCEIYENFKYLDISTNHISKWTSQPKYPSMNSTDLLL